MLEHAAPLEFTLCGRVKSQEKVPVSFVADSAKIVKAKKKKKD